MATGSGLASIEQGKPLDVPLSDPATPSETWKSLAHSDSTASIEAEENIVTERVDSVALAHMRLDKLNKANDSIAVARKRFSGQNSRDETDSPSSSQGPEAVGSPSSSLNRKGSPGLGPLPGLSAGFKRISGAFKKLHVGRDSAGSQPSSQGSQGDVPVPAPHPSAGSPRVRFSMDETREAS